MRKAAALLIYLAEAGGPVAREVAATLLWPETDEETARARLRRTLYKVRTAFGSEVIGGTGASLSLHPALSVEVDSRVFEHACNFGSLDEAADIYTGDFLAGFSLPDCPEFEEWVFFRREALRSRLVQALERLIEAKVAGVGASTRGRARDAPGGSGPFKRKRAPPSDPCPPGGRGQGGSRAPDRVCARLLQKELGIAADPTTLALVREPSHAATLDVPRTRYVEVDGIHLAFQTVGSGPPDIVLVPGFISHVERVWEDGRCRAWITAVSRPGSPDPLRPARHGTFRPRRRPSHRRSDGAGYLGSHGCGQQPPGLAHRRVRGWAGLHPFCCRPPRSPDRPCSLGFPCERQPRTRLSLRFDRRAIRSVEATPDRQLGWPGGNRNFRPEPRRRPPGGDLVGRIAQGSL